MTALLRFSLRYRLVVVVASLALLVYGSYLAATLPIDVFPDLDRPRVVLLTECPGLATEEVETLVTQPIETALLGANGVQAVRSQSTSGLSVIYVEFDWTTDVRAARQIVQERLTTASGILPEGIRPQMTPTASIMGQIVIAGISRQTGPRGGELTPIGDTGLLAELSSPETAGDPARRRLQVWRPVDRHRLETWQEVKPGNLAMTAPTAARITLDGLEHDIAFPSPLEQRMELRTLADWVVRPRLLKIPGVAEIFVQGGDRKQYQILVDPTALLEYGVTLADVETALQESNINTSGGFAVTGETERPIRVLGRLGPDSDRVIEDLRKVPVRTPRERPILLEQVARVTEGPQFQRGDGAINGVPGVVLTIAKQPHVDTRELTDELTAAMRETEAALPATSSSIPACFSSRTSSTAGSSTSPRRWSSGPCWCSSSCSCSCLTSARRSSR